VIDALHVTNGDSVAIPLRQASGWGEARGWNDAYHEGPLRSGERSRFLDARAEFLASCGWGGVGAIREDLAARDALFVDALREGRSVVLWFEHDLYDQLQLVDILALAGETGFDPRRLELIEVDSFPGMPRFRGLGELNPEQLESLWPQRRAVTDDDTGAAQRAWEAVRRSDPRGVAELRDAPPTARPFLGAALGRFLEELPAVENGLSRTERQLLELLEAGPLLTGALFVASQDLEEAPFHGDFWIFRTLERLAPLVSVQGEVASITDDGRRVLAGDLDALDVLPIDRWVGGTHLLPGSVWRWDVEAAAPLAPTA
jgi:hypothetical protein